MTTGTSLNDVKNLLGQIKNYGLNSGFWGLSEQEKGYVNSVWTAGEGVDEIANGSDEEKVQGVQKLLNQLMSLVGKMNEANDARREVAEQEKKAQTINSNTEEIQRKITTAINDIGNGINEEAEVIDAANGEITTAQEKLEEQQKELKETLEKIAKLQQELGQATNPEEQNNLLGQIATLSAAIPNIVSEIANIQQILVDNVNEVASSVEVMQELEGTAETTAEQGIKDIKEETDESKRLAAEGTTTTATGAVNEGVEIAAREAQTVTTAISIVPGAGAAAQAENQKLREIETDQGGAARERIPGGAATMKSVAQALGTLNSSLNYLAEFKNSIGTGLSNYANLVGSFNENVEPMITSLGSFNDGKEILESKAELDAAVEEDFASIKETNGTEETENSTPEMLRRPEENSNQRFGQNVWSTQPANFFGAEEEQKNNLKTPKVNVVQFGI